MLGRDGWGREVDGWVMDNMDRQLAAGGWMRAGGPTAEMGANNWTVRVDRTSGVRRVAHGLMLKLQCGFDGWVLGDYVG